MSEPIEISTVDEPQVPNYRRRRLAVGLTALALVGGGVIAAVAVNGSDEPLTIAVETSTSTSTSTTTVAPTTSTSTTTTSTSTTTTSTSTTTTTTVPPPTTILVDNVPVWEPYEPLPPLDGIAALTGEPADETITKRPIIAAKIDNFRRARPQWSLDQADVIIEENVEGVTRFVALFHTRLPDRVGPIRSARTGDLDLLAAMNRPILAWSGGNPGVTSWIESAASSGVLVNFTAQRSPCYNRNSSRSAPHNLQLDPTCAIENSPTAGPARSLWAIDGSWEIPAAVVTTLDTTFGVTMDGVDVEWRWDPDTQKYLRSQNGQPHVAASGAQIAVDNVVEMRTFHAPSPVDGRSPNPLTAGGGTTAVIHRSGVAFEANWFRQTAFDQFKFTDRATGTRIPLATGTTFVELVRDR